MTTITLTGNLTRDPEKKETANSHLWSFGVACNGKYRGEDVTTFYDCSAWKGMGDVMAQYLKKGAFVVVVGKLNIVQKDGKTYNNVEVLDFAFGPKVTTGYVPDTEPAQLGDDFPF
jgi:single-stranded DNA-binding protein